MQREGSFLLHKSPLNFQIWNFEHATERERPPLEAVNWRLVKTVTEDTRVFSDEL
jgi:hypothetical protein